MSRKTLSVWVEPHGKIIINFWDSKTGKVASYTRPIEYLRKFGWILNRMALTHKYITKPFFAGAIGITLETKPSEEAE